MRGNRNDAAQMRARCNFNSCLYMRGNMVPGCQKNTRQISIHTSTWEATKQLGRIIWNWAISFHASTWEATGQSVEEISEAYISIHASTWEATKNTWTIQNQNYFNSRLYMRGNIFPYFFSPLFKYFNSRLYMRGNAKHLGSSRNRNISIHASTWEATFRATKSIYDCIFQFTPLHERQPVTAIEATDEVPISIHASTWEATDKRSRRIRKIQNFNSRLYMRGNNHGSESENDSCTISIHASTWEATYCGVDLSAGGDLFQFTPLHERQLRHLRGCTVAQ